MHPVLEETVGRRREGEGGERGRGGERGGEGGEGEGERKPPHFRVEKRHLVIETFQLWAHQKR